MIDAAVAAAVATVDEEAFKAGIHGPAPAQLSNFMSSSSISPVSFLLFFLAASLGDFTALEEHGISLLGAIGSTMKVV